MSGTLQGAIRAAARRLRMSELGYRTMLAAGKKWCTGCRKWQPRILFGVDRSRYDSLASVCLERRGIVARLAYIPSPGPEPGRRFVAARSGDKLQARRRVNYLVEIGLLPRPEKIACCDCGHFEKGRRHEYDHFCGYEPKNHEVVESVCSRCHRQRSMTRGEWARRK